MCRFMTKEEIEKALGKDFRVRWLEDSNNWEILISIYSRHLCDPELLKKNMAGADHIYATKHKMLWSIKNVVDNALGIDN